MEKELKIEIPEGYEIDKEQSTFERIVFKKKEAELPESWEDFCSITKKEGYYLDPFSAVSHISSLKSPMSCSKDRNLLSTQEDCEAHRALMQLHRLRDCYRQGWDETIHDGMGWVVYVDYRNNLDRIRWGYGKGFLTFQNKEMAEEFAKNFGDLILTAKKLLR